MEGSIDVKGPRYRNIESMKISVLPSFSAQYTCRTKEGLTEKVTLHVYTAGKERQRKNRRGGNEKEVFKVQCQLVQQRTEKLLGLPRHFY
jgi:hypothetical protein